jgi:predicted nucleotidyltransferase
MRAVSRTDAVETMLADATAWVHSRSDVVGLVLVGSYARGTARADSDVDVVVIVEDAHVLIDDTDWTGLLGAVDSLEREDYGLVQSVFARYVTGIEVEWGITDRRWLATAPLDPDTVRVVADGARILYDPYGLVRAFIDAASATRETS